MLQHCLRLGKQETCHHVVEQRHFKLFLCTRKHANNPVAMIHRAKLAISLCKFIAPFLHSFVNLDKQVFLHVAYVMRHGLKQGQAAKNLALLFYLLCIYTRTEILVSDCMH